MQAVCIAAVSCGIISDYRMNSSAKCQRKRLGRYRAVPIPSPSSPGDLKFLHWVYPKILFHFQGGLPRQNVDHEIRREEELDDEVIIMMRFMPFAGYAWVQSAGLTPRERFQPVFMKQSLELFRGACRVRVTLPRKERAEVSTALVPPSRKGNMGYVKQTSLPNTVCVLSCTIMTREMSNGPFFIAQRVAMREPVRCGKRAFIQVSFLPCDSALSFALSAASTPSQGGRALRTCRYSESYPWRDFLPRYGALGA
jgi:hypothetical protein